MWFYLAILSGIFLSFRRIAEKPLTGKLDYFTLGWAAQLFSLPLLIIIFWVSGHSILISSATTFWIPLLIIWLLLYPIQTYCYYKALHIGEISIVVPVISFVPVFTMIIAWITIGEIPSTFGFFGITNTASGGTG